MGIYLNPDNVGFKRVLAEEIYGKEKEDNWRILLKSDCNLE